jgi:hypothetical protein
MPASAGFLHWSKQMDEATRQFVGTLAIAIGEAAGPEVLERACRSIDVALGCGVVPSLVAQSSLRQLTGSIREARALAEDWGVE